MNEDLTRKIPDQPNGKLDELFQLIQAIRAELSDLRNTMETRLYDTRPIWEALKAEIDQLRTGQDSLRAGQDSLREGQDSLRGDVREIRTHLRDMDRRLSIFNDTLVGLKADYRDIYDRVREIERQRS